MALDRPMAGPAQVPPPRGWRRNSGARGHRRDQPSSPPSKCRPPSTRRV
jgi:hypothetical protein